MKNLIRRVDEIRNDQSVKVVIHLASVDDANALARALKQFSKYAGIGGDCEMFVSMSDGDPESIGRIGHDVIVRKVETLIGE
jgi:hypothetical protein